jgi:hypothetical protein
MVHDYFPAQWEALPPTRHRHLEMGGRGSRRAGSVLTIPQDRHFSSSQASNANDFVHAAHVAHVAHRVLTPLRKMCKMPLIKAPNTEHGDVGRYATGDSHPQRAPKLVADCRGVFFHGTNLKVHFKIKGHTPRRSRGATARSHFPLDRGMSATVSLGSMHPLYQEGWRVSDGVCAPFSCFMITKFQSKETLRPSGLRSKPATGCNVTLPPL